MPLPGDYDGDGTTDVAIYRPSTAQWWVLTSSSQFTSYTVQGVGHGWRRRRPGRLRRRWADTTVSTVREVLRNRDTAESYRLVLTCDAASREGQMQLAWSPVPTIGSFKVISDRVTRGHYQVQGKERMGNGVGASSGLAAHTFQGTILLPSLSLIVRDLFPNETVEFTFSDLADSTRQQLAPCLNR